MSRTTHQILQGHVIEVLKTLPADSVQCVVTSPPYYGLRDYGLPPQIWGGAEDCEHDWLEHRQSPKGGKNKAENMPNTGSNFTTQTNNDPRFGVTSNFCHKCSAWRGSLGLEPTPHLFIEHLVLVFREVWRVLRPDGTLFLNLGDSYFSNPGNGRGGGSTLSGAKPHLSGVGRVRAYGNAGKAELNSLNCGCAFQNPCDEHKGYFLRNISDIQKCPTKFKPKDLMMMPHRAAIALQDDGWFVRQDIVWAKQNPMPESVTDRCTKSHEYIFLLTKSQNYYFDAEAIKEKSQKSSSDRYKYAFTGRPEMVLPNGKSQQLAMQGQRDFTEYRNKRSVWTTATEHNRDAHFATFPEKLIEPCILAGTSEFGCCKDCGAPYLRIVEKQTDWQNRKANGASAGNVGASDDYQNSVHGDNNTHHHLGTLAVKQIGWRKSCECETGEIKPCVVMDIFNGSGTTGRVALKFKRDYTGIELKSRIH